MCVCKSREERENKKGKYAQTYVWHFLYKIN